MPDAPDTNFDPGPPGVGVLLRLAWLLHRDRMYERLTAAGYPDVTPAQFALLRYPGVDGLRPSDAAELAGISKQTVNDLLGELERDGYLERKPHHRTDAAASCGSPRPEPGSRAC